MQMADRFDEMKLSGFKLSYASERILRLIGEQLHFQFVPYGVDTGDHHIILVEAEKMYQLTDYDIEVLRQLPNVVLIYMGQHHDHWLWSEKINAIGVLSLPLTVEKVRKLLNTLMNKMNAPQKQ
jgi:nitrate reductase NapAB chaperone NapD